MPHSARSLLTTLLAPALLLALSPAACAQTPTPPPTSDQPPGQTPEQPKGDVGEAAEAAEIVARQADAELQALLDALERVDRETDSLRAGLYHVTENFVTGLKETRTGTLTLLTQRDEHPSGLALRRFRVDINALIFDGQKHDEATSYIFDGTWLAERIEDEKQYNKWQLVRPGERFDPMDEMQGSAIWLPVGIEVDRLRRDYDAALVPPNEFFEGETMGQTLADVTNAGDGSVQLRLRPRDPNDPIEEIRLWFDARTYLPRAHAVLDGEGLQVSTLFGVKQNPGDVDEALFDTADPPAREGWDVTARPWRGGE
ncbi:MAG: outer membrane lipoprotein carrier protein LolA [Phycisphaerales bacterium JB040]